jgi:hypothetical protein
MRSRNVISKASLAHHVAPRLVLGVFAQLAFWSLTVA